MESLTAGPSGIALAAAVGLCVGSFANVAIHRIPIEGLSVWKPARSFCPSCGTRLAWRENVPVLAWLLQRGRCRTCGTAISWRYPAVELLVAALFVLFWSVQPPVDAESLVLLLVRWSVAFTCVVVSAIDLQHFIIPDVITLPGTALGVLLSAALPALHEGGALWRPEQPHASAVVSALAGALAGGGSLWLVGRLGNVFLRKQIEEAGVEDAMGLGDVKWMAFAGTFLGPLLVLEAILTACFAGALVGIVMKLIARARGQGLVGLPFGPFLSAGILVELVWPGAVWSVLGP